MIKHQTKNQKPIEYDIHLKYLCQKCGQPHWLSFKEASTKNYKIVCDCNHVFKVKRILDFKLKYATTKQTIVKTPSHTIPIKQQTIPSDTLTGVVKTLTNLGFTNSEAKNLATKTYSDFPTEDIGSLVKQILENIKNVKQCN